MTFPDFLKWLFTYALSGFWPFVGTMVVLNGIADIFKKLGEGIASIVKARAEARASDARSITLQDIAAMSGRTAAAIASDTTGHRVVQAVRSAAGGADEEDLVGRERRLATLARTVELQLVQMQNIAAEIELSQARANSPIRGESVPPTETRRRRVGMGDLHASTARIQTAPTPSTPTSPAPEPEPEPAPPEPRRPVRRLQLQSDGEVPDASPPPD